MLCSRFAAVTVISSNSDSSLCCAVAVGAKPYAATTATRAAAGFMELFILFPRKCSAAMRGRFDVYTRLWPQTGGSARQRRHCAQSYRRAGLASLVIPQQFGNEKIGGELDNPFADGGIFVVEPETVAGAGKNF